jgi:hypothetical protein
MRRAIRSSFRRRRRYLATMGDRVGPRRLALVLVAVALVIVILFALRTGPEKKRASGTPEEPDDNSQSTGAAHAFQPAPPASSALAVADAAPPPEPEPIIDEVTVEKREVCEGEENLVTVRAHTVNGTDDYLHYHIGTELGSSVPVRIWPAPDGTYTRPIVSVFGRNNATARVQMPDVRIKRCKSMRNAFIDARVNPNTRAEFTLSARVVDLPAPDARSQPKPFQPVSFAWTFGDGASATTKVPWVVHSYEDRPQDAVYAQFVVGVEVMGDDGQKVSARRALELLNPVAEAFKVKGIVQLLFVMDPRFPELDAHGVVHEHVRLFHLRPESVTIEKMLLTRVYVEGTGEAPPEVIEPSSVLGTTVIPPGRGIEFDLTLDTNSHQDTFGLTYQVMGHSAAGNAAQCMFSILRPPPKPTANSHDPIWDGELLAKVKRARELLHRETVTDEDIWQLEREGKFVGLKPEVVPPPTAFPTNLPKPPVPASTDRIPAPGPSGSTRPPTPPPASPPTATSTSEAPPKK